MSFGRPNSIFLTLTVTLTLASQSFAFTADQCPISVDGSDEASFKTAHQKTPPAETLPLIFDTKKYDVVIVGAGLSGLSTAVFLTAKHKKVLLVEKSDYLGGLAASVTESNGVIYDRGAAYWTSPFKEELHILQAIGLGKYEKKNPIPEPIDSYLWNGKLYKGVWDKDTLAELPASFAIFKYVLSKANDEKLIPDQPIEDFGKRGGHLDLDNLTAAEWIRSMPAKFATYSDGEHDAIKDRYDTDTKNKRIDAQDPMKDVLDFLDLYCRSALGTTADGVSAVAFANFYISEIDTRYTTQRGTGEAAKNMEAILKKRKKLVDIVTNGTVVNLTNEGDHVAVTYNTKKLAHRVEGQYVVYAAQLKFAPDIISGLIEQSPDQADLMTKMKYANYAVDTVKVKGHPFRAGYDTWVRGLNYSEMDFTDIINALWLNPEIEAIKEPYMNFAAIPKDPKLKNGIYTIYHPLTQDQIDNGFTDDQAKVMARHALKEFFDQLTPLVKTQGQVLSCTSDVSHKWAYSVHIAKKGHFLNDVNILKRPFGNIFFADNNLGTPAFEEALYRGHCAANNVLSRMDPKFSNEKWSECFLEK